MLFCTAQIVRLRLSNEKEERFFKISDLIKTDYED